MNISIFSTIVSVFNIGGKIINASDLYNAELTIIRRDGSQSESRIAGHDWQKTVTDEWLTLYFYTGKVVRWNPEYSYWEEKSLNSNTSWNKVSFYISITDLDIDDDTEIERLLSFPVIY